MRPEIPAELEEHVNDAVSQEMRFPEHVPFAEKVRFLLGEREELHAELNDIKRERAKAAMQASGEGEPGGRADRSSTLGGTSANSGGAREY